MVDVDGLAGTKAAIVAHVFGTALLLVVADVSVPGVRVMGTATCPTPAAIERRLAELPARRAASGESPRTVWVDRDATGAVVLRLGGGGGQEERRLPGDLPCDELAAAAAVTVATWLLGSSAEGPVSAPPSQPPVLRAQPPAPTRAVDSPAVARGDLGVGASASFAPAWAPGATARGSIASAGNVRWGVTAFAGWEAPRRMALGEGRVRWWRASGGLGLQRVVGGQGGVGVQLHLEAAVAWIALAGEGFEENHHAGGLSPGATAGVRLVLAGEGRHLAPWIDLTLAAWPLGQRAMAMPSGAQEIVPRLALALTVGVAWLAWPARTPASST
jgi:hypothetical protein